MGSGTREGPGGDRPPGAGGRAGRRGDVGMPGTCVCVGSGEAWGSPRHGASAVLEGEGKRTSPPGVARCLPLGPSHDESQGLHLVSPCCIVIHTLACPEIRTPVFLVLVLPQGAMEI